MKGKGKKAKTVTKRVALKSASYDDASHTVTLIVGGKLAAKSQAGAHDPHRRLDRLRGRSLDGDGDGQPGGDYSAKILHGVGVRSIRIR